MKKEKETIKEDNMFSELSQYHSFLTSPCRVSSGDVL